MPTNYHDYLRYRPNIITQLQPPHVYRTAQQNMAAINCRERYTSIGIAVPTFANKRSQHVSKQQYHWLLSAQYSMKLSCLYRIVQLR